MSKSHSTRAVSYHTQCNGDFPHGTTSKIIIYFLTNLFNIKTYTYEQRKKNRFEKN